MGEDTQGREGATGKLHHAAPSLRPPAGISAATQVRQHSRVKVLFRAAQKGSRTLVPNRTIIRMTLTYDKQS